MPTARLFKPTTVSTDNNATMHKATAALRILAATWILIVAMTPSAMAQVNKEALIKAAYLLNFARFTTWPEDAFASPDAPIVLCIAGTSPITDALPSIAKKRVQNRALQFKQLAPGEKVPEACHMLLVGNAPGQSMTTLTQSIASRPILTVSIQKGFSMSGGMLTLIKVKNKIRFQINLATTEKAGLTMSSRLLKLAIVVGP